MRSYISFLAGVLLTTVVIFGATLTRAADNPPPESGHYRAGYRDGYRDGFRDAYRDGYQEGHKDGYKLGFSEGHK